MQTRQRSVKSIIAAIERHKIAIGKRRDQLRDLYNELDLLLDTTNDAIDSLDYAIERLSELT